MKAQYAILRFAKYKGPEIGHIESHNERTKEKYASNPDVDMSRSHLNFHLVTPQRKYRAEAEKQIAEAGCRTRSDSVRVVEALVTASPEFFKGKKKGEIKAYFQEALDFMQKHQSKDTIISAVVHMDEKTPHMHLCFVPLTADGRLSAKEIVGNKKKLTQWQDRFWEHMVKKYPDLERGESASETGRDHIPPRVFKEMTRLTKQKAKLEELLAGVNAFNAKGKAAEIGAFLDKYIPAVEQMHTTLKKYNTAFTVTIAENKKLKKETEQLEQSLDKATQESTLKKLADAKLHRDYEDAVAVLDRIPQESGADAYFPSEQTELAHHLRDHLLTNREGYVSLAQLAAEHEMSVSHLQKLFKQVYGVPVYRYIKEYRLEQAAVELVRSRKPITEIAQRAGYDNASKFSESFKKRYGKTPSRYRADKKQTAKRSIGNKTE